MKKIYSLLFVVFSLPLFISCEDENDLTKTFKDFSFLSFESTDRVLTVLENAGTVSIPVYLTEPQDVDVQVSVVLTDDSAVVNENYTFVSTSITIPAGQYEAAFQLNLVDDSDFNESRRFNIKLQSTSSLVVGLAGASGSSEKTVVIVNDDCPSQYAFWFGLLSVEDVGFGSTPGVGSANLNGDCDVLLVDNNLPGEAAPVNTKFELIFTPDPADPLGSFGTVEVVDTTVRQRTFTVGGVATLCDVKYRATGFYDTATGEIFLDYNFRAFNAATGNLVGTYYDGQNVITLQ